MKQRNIWISWAMVVIWMMLIFSFSSQVGSTSGALSGSVVGFIEDIWTRTLPNWPLNLDALHLFIRKAAHFIVYLILGFLTTRALYTSHIPYKKRIFLALLISFLYASSDEIHQAFVPNRGPSFWDVLLDTLGASVGLYFYEKLLKLQTPN